MCLAKDHLKAVSDVFGKLQNDYDLLKSKQSEYDSKLSSLYHEIEVGRFSGVGGYKKIQQLQKLLRERRIVKHELSQVHHVVMHLAPEKVLEKIHITSRNVGKSESGNQEYRNGWNMKIEDILVTS